MTDSNEEPKIVVDSDWKSQVQAEKEALKAKEEAESAAENAESSEAASEADATTDSAAATGEATTTEAASEATAGAADEPMEFPPASFTMLVTTISAQAMTALGFFPDPTTGKPNENRPMAKHFIDTLGILEEKTKGNLTSEEATLVQETLHQLRMAFINPTG